MMSQSLLSIEVIVSHFVYIMIYIAQLYVCVAWWRSG